MKIQFNHVFKLAIDVNKIAEALVVNVDDVRNWDGRAWSQQLESRVNKEFELTPCTSSGHDKYDHILPDGRKADSKIFTKGKGGDLSPSMHKGDKGLAARILREEGQTARDLHDAKKKEEYVERVSNMVYVLTDISHIQCNIDDNIYIVFMNGKEVMKYASETGKITRLVADKLFSGELWKKDWQS